MQGGARTGDGLFVDCIAPIIRQTPQPPRASRPLPKIDLQLVADCKAQNPNFGQRNAPPSQAAQPPAQSSPLPRAVTPQVAPAQQRNAPPSQAVVPPASTQAGRPSRRSRALRRIRRLPTIENWALTIVRPCRVWLKPSKPTKAKTRFLNST